MELDFIHIKAFELEERFQTEEDCLKYLSDNKWKDGFVCRNCGHTHFCQGKKPFSRRCTKCKKEESATANTVFHRCKIPLPIAFSLAWKVCNQQDISSWELSRQTAIRQMTCWKLSKKIKECRQNLENSSGSYSAITF